MRYRNNDLLKLLDILVKKEIDFRNIDAATPILLLGILSAYHQGKLRVKGLDGLEDVNPNLYGYLLHCGFLDYFYLDNISPQFDYHTLIPIARIHKNLDPLIANQIASKISTDDIVRYSFSFLLRELLDNTTRHSKADFDQFASYYMLQKYRRSKSVHICIVDNGIGIRKSLENKYKNLGNDIDYILKAFEKGVTSRGNAGGNGLYFTKEIILGSNSKLNYWSGGSVYMIKDGNEFYIDTEKYYGLSWKGVLLDIELNLNNIRADLMKKIGINVEEELNNLEDDLFI